MRRPGERVPPYTGRAFASADAQLLGPFPFSFPDGGPEVSKRTGSAGELRHDAYSHRKITLLELTEMRRSVSTQAETYKAGAIVRQSFAAMRAAEAQEKMAEVLASVEHGGAAVMLLSRLREGLTDGRARPLPRAVPARLQPPTAEPA